jgi:SAM-dependent methyltransferase
MAVEPVRAGADWLELREPADADARSTALVDDLLGQLPSDAVTVVHDLGSGTGSMLRWLSPRLPTPQHWVLHDRDAELLQVALDKVAPDAGLSVEARHGDLSRLAPETLGDATLLTASALLDMLTADELGRLVDLCVGVGRPVLVTLSVTGEVTFTPEDALDARLRDAFNAHQRRNRGAGRLLGPDAAAAAVDRFARHGCEVRTTPSLWSLGADRPELARAWFEGWVGAAVEQQPGLASVVPDYRERRLGQLADGRLTVMVHHLDLLALPRAPAAG